MAAVEAAWKTAEEELATINSLPAALLHGHSQESCREG